AYRLEVSKQKNGVCQIADIDRSVNVRSDESVLGNCHQCRNSLLAQIRQQFVQLHCQKLLSRHCIQEAIQAVDDKQLQILLFNQVTNLVDELTGRKFRGIYLAKSEFSRVNVLLDIQPQAFSPDQ